MGQLNLQKGGFPDIKGSLFGSPHNEGSNGLGCILGPPFMETTKFTQSIREKGQQQQCMSCC